MTDKRDEVIKAARKFALTKHKLFFDRDENLVVGSNFIHTMADFAIQHASDVRRKIADELERITNGSSCEVNALIGKLRGKNNG